MKNLQRKLYNAEGIWIQIDTRVTLFINCVSEIIFYHAMIWCILLNICMYKRKIYIYMRIHSAHVFSNTISHKLPISVNPSPNVRVYQ